MIKADGIDGHEVGQVVLVRIVVAMPGNNIKWRVILYRETIMVIIFFFLFAQSIKNPSNNLVLFLHTETS